MNLAFGEVSADRRVILLAGDMSCNMSLHRVFGFHVFKEKNITSILVLLCSVSIPAVQTGTELVLLWAGTIYIRNHYNVKEHTAQGLMVCVC